MCHRPGCDLQRQGRISGLEYNLVTSHKGARISVSTLHPFLNLLEVFTTLRGAFQQKMTALDQQHVALLRVYQVIQIFLPKKAPHTN